jgi:hypothetical protein
MDPTLRTAALDLMNLKQCQILSSLTNKQAPWITVLLEKLVKKFPAFYGACRFFYRFHNSPTPVPFLRQINPVHALDHTSLTLGCLTYIYIYIYIKRYMLYRTADLQMLNFKYLFNKYLYSTEYFKHAA